MSSARNVGPDLRFAGVVRDPPIRYTISIISGVLLLNYGFILVPSGWCSDSKSIVVLKKRRRIGRLLLSLSPLFDNGRWIQVKRCVEHLSLLSRILYVYNKRDISKNLSVLPMMLSLYLRNKTGHANISGERWPMSTPPRIS
jgi:hypothetical protein